MNKIISSAVSVLFNLPGLVHVDNIEDLSFCSQSNLYSVKFLHRSHIDLSENGIIDMKSNNVISREKEPEVFKLTRPKGQEML